MFPKRVVVEESKPQSAASLNSRGRLHEQFKRIGKVSDDLSRMRLDAFFRLHYLRNCVALVELAESRVTHGVRSDIDQWVTVHFGNLIPAQSEFLCFLM